MAGEKQIMIKISGSSDDAMWRNNQFFKGFTNYLTWVVNKRFNLYAFRTQHGDDLDAIATAMRSDVEKRIRQMQAAGDQERFLFVLADALAKHVDWQQLADMTYWAQHWERFYANQ